jgi:predicted transcriptional regulator
MSTNHVSVRLEPEIIARVDALAPQFSTQWRPATRSDVLRALILTALAGQEARALSGEAPAIAGAGAAGRGRGKGRAGKSEREPR